MATSTVRRIVNAPVFATEQKNLTTISGNYLQGSVAKTGYTPVGILGIDGTGISASNTIRLFYIDSSGTARVNLHETPTSGSYITATILYRKN
jgi:hypothetical protein